MKYFLGLCVLISSACFAQKSFDRGEYDVFISKYSKNKKQNDADINFKLGEAYRLSNRPLEAIPYYEEAIKKGLEEEAVYINLARAYRFDQNIKKAKQLLDEYLPKARDEELIKKAEGEMASLRKIDEVKSKSSYYRVKNLSEINTPAAEYSPTYSNNYLYFTSNRNATKIYRATGTGYTDLYRIGTRGANVNINTLRPLPAEINDPNIKLMLS